MKKKLCIILSLLLSLFSFAQEEEGASFVTYWSEGDSYEFEIRTEKIKRINDSLVDHKIGLSKAVLEVIEEMNDHYIIDLKLKTYGDLFSDDTIPSPLNDLIEDSEKLKIRYKTSDLGAFLEVVNHDEIEAFMDKIMNKITSETSIDSKAFKDAMQIVKSKEFIEEKMLENIQLIHYPLGYEFTFDTNYYSSETTNLFDPSKPIKTNGYAVVLDYSKDSGVYRIKNYDEIDQKEMVKMMKVVFKKMNLKNKKTKKELKKMKYDFQESITYDFLIDKTIPKNINYIKEVVITNQDRKTEITNITNIKFLERLKPLITEETCKTLHTGTFVSKDDSGRTVTVLRNDQFQIDSMHDYVNISEIKWIDDCFFTSKLVKSTSSEFSPLLGTEIEIQLINFDENNILTYECFVPLYDLRLSQDVLFEKISDEADIDYQAKD